MPTQAQTSRGARSLYIHVPFCFHKCHYCDFYSIVDTRDRQVPFVERLERELAALYPLAGPIETIFVGGGTPSLLRVDLWARLLDALHRHFDLSSLRSGGRGGPGEFTVECNPETVTPELMGLLASRGVNRVSMGAQSFSEKHLKTLERWHHPENVARAMQVAADAGIVRRNVDLIFGVPGQTLDEWREDLLAALELGTDHLSCYNLTYEPNTAMTARLKRGEFQPADEDVEVEMYRETVALLRERGLSRYEVSNYAKPGEECRHNLAYWRQRDWLAAGPSASGHLAGYRWKNTPRLDDYLAFDDAGFASVVDAETPDEKRAVRERIMTGLRLREGLETTDLWREAERVSPGASERLERLGKRLVGRGWLEMDAARWWLNDDGFLMADAAAAELMGCVG